MSTTYDMVFAGAGVLVSTALVYNYGSALLVEGTKRAISTYVDLKYWWSPPASSIEERSDGKLSLKIMHQNDRYIIYRVQETTYVTFGSVPQHDHVLGSRDKVAELIVHPVHHYNDVLNEIIHQLGGYHADFHDRVPSLEEVRLVYPQLHPEITKIIVNTEDMEEFIIT